MITKAQLYAAHAREEFRILGDDAGTLSAVRAAAERSIASGYLRLGASFDDGSLISFGSTPGAARALDPDSLDGFELADALSSLQRGKVRI